MWMRVVLVVFISSILGQAQPCRDIRSVDFRNTIIRTSPTDENEMRGLFNAPSGTQTFNFKKGVSEDFLDEAQRKAETPEGRATISLDSVLTPASGVVVRFLVVTWEHQQGPGGHSFVLGFVCRNHAVQQIFQFSAEYGPDFEVGPDKELVIKQSIWREHDPHCCPTQTRTLYYDWNTAQQRFRRIRVDGPKPIASQRQADH
jgi:hypothetical protein